MIKYAVLLALVFTWGCSKEEFAGSPKTEKYTANSVEVFQNLTCANHTLVKPPVDILYVVDNSLSAGYLSSTVKDQIRLTIQTVSQEFDYHIMVAPLLADGQSDTFRPVITNNASGMAPSVNVVSLEGLQFFNTPQGVNNEPGFARSTSLISNNRSNGIFRNGAHTIIVLVSNGDDTDTKSCFNGQCFPNNTAYDSAYNNFINLKGSLSAQQFRFFSLVAHTANCKSGYAEGKMYKMMSSRVYSAMNATDQSSRSTPDSYDLCSSTYNLYAGINESIRQEVVGHTYNRWLVSSGTSQNVIESVTKISPNGTATTVPMDATNGYTCCTSGTQNTRILPTVGEPKTGTFIELNGSGQVVYPQCLVVKSRTPTEYYGYAVVPSKPKPDTIVVRIRGNNIPQSTTNGWSYTGYLENQNIKFTNAAATTAANPPLNRTGYFIKLNGSAVYASGDTVEVYYTPEGI
ncbi:MAG: hypothetical protein K2P81_08050 [Bacteriovoracaceae bacterium]|nr:hypothetical protein [Bacteriovoracaceae bacterium]